MHYYRRVFNAADVLKNNRVSVEELNTLYSLCHTLMDGGARSSEQLRKKSRADVKRWFKQIDVNGNGDVSEEEFVAALIQRGGSVVSKARGADDFHDKLRRREMETEVLSAAEAIDAAPSVRIGRLLGLGCQVTLALLLFPVTPVGSLQTLS